MTSPLGVLDRLRRAPKTVAILAILDQSIYALTNLALQILVARSGSVEDFGAYSVGSTFFFVAAMAHQTCIIEPMFVFTSQRYGQQIGAYHRRLRREWSIGFGAAVLIVGLILALATWTLGSAPLAKTLFAFAVASPFLLYLWLVRRMAFVLGRIDVAVLGGVIYSLSLFGTTGLVWYAGHMSAGAAIGLSGLAAVGASLAVTVKMRWSLPGTPPPRDMVYQHFRYGRWAASSEAVIWLITNGPIVVLPIWFGLGAAAQLRVLTLLFMPLLQVVSALTSLLLRRYASPGRDVNNIRTIFKFFWILVAVASVYSVLVIAFGTIVAPLAFGQGGRIEEGWLVLGAAATTCFVATQGFFVALRAQEHSHLVLLVHIGVLLIMVGLLPLAAVAGISGILLAQTIAWGVAVVGAGLLVWREGSIGAEGFPDAMPRLWFRKAVRS
jgi:O-antigen/teichoic acid export membrane protein